MTRNRTVSAQAVTASAQAVTASAQAQAQAQEQIAFMALSDTFKAMLLEQAQAEATSMHQAVKQQAFIASQRQGFDGLSASQKQIIVNACHEQALKPVVPVKTLKSTISVNPSTNSGKLLQAITAQAQTAQDLLAMVQDRNGATEENRLSALHKRIMEFKKHHGINVVYDATTQTYSIKNS